MYKMRKEKTEIYFENSIHLENLRNFMLEWQI